MAIFNREQKQTKLKPLHSSFKITVSLLFLSQVLSAQTTGSGSSYLLYALIALGIGLLVYAILSIADNMMQIEAKSQGVDTAKNNFGIFPSLSDLFKPKSGSHVTKGDNLVALKQGHDIKLEGEASTETMLTTKAKHFAIKPTNYRGMAPIPKVTVAVGDRVKAGQDIMFDKNNPEIRYCAPVSGEFVELRRGAKRAISDLIFKADDEMEFVNHKAPDLASASREDILAFLLAAGGWAHINQRPFDVIPDPKVTPKNIFVSTFDSAPNAPDLNAVVAGNEAAFQKGLNGLNRLTDGNVYLGLDGRAGHTSHTAFKDAQGVEKNYFAGKHPSGNVGVQIHHTAPINSGDVVWTLSVQDVIVLGRLFMTGMYDTRTKIAFTGAEINNGYVETYMGASVAELVGTNLKSDHIRIVSGDVLSGDVLPVDGFLNNNTDQISILKEGDDYELFGWLLPLKPRPSVSPTFPMYVFPNHKFEANTNTHGESRAFVQTGAYEKVLPMDIYPQHLMKAIMAGDFENMEGLGILELSEEDLALCEFICPSKTPMQSILRDGLDMMRDQM